MVLIHRNFSSILSVPQCFTQALINPGHTRNFLSMQHNPNDETLLYRQCCWLHKTATNVGKFATWFSKKKIGGHLGLSAMFVGTLATTAVCRLFIAGLAATDVTARRIRTQLFATRHGVPCNRATFVHIFREERKEKRKRVKMNRNA